jgi:uncharacterized protein
MPGDSLSASEARALALAAQGFGRPRDEGTTDIARLRGMAEQLGVIQIDSVNVLVRSHYLPLFSRLGAYPREILDRLAYGPRRALFEYWAHEASFVPADVYPLLRWRMDRARAGMGMWKHVAELARERPEVIDRVERAIADRGPLAASDLTESERGRGSWWEWSESKRALEFLFWSGRLTTRARRHFERVYDLVERVLPARVLRAPRLDAEAQQRALVARACKALGVATERDLRDYFRLPAGDAHARLLELVEAGEIRPVRVAGWKHAAYVYGSLRLPRDVDATALLSPFDSLVWDRGRTERLFGFRFRLEIYTPAHRRVHGYYVLPFLLGDELVARLDLKSDRASKVLLVRGLHLEAAAAPKRVLPPLRRELARLAGWLGLHAIEGAGFDARLDGGRRTRSRA